MVELAEAIKQVEKPQQVLEETWGKGPNHINVGLSLPNVLEIFYKLGQKVDILTSQDKKTLVIRRKTSLARIMAGEKDWEKTGSDSLTYFAFGIEDIKSRAKGTREEVIPHGNFIAMLSSSSDPKESGAEIITTLTTKKARQIIAKTLGHVPENFHLRRS